MSTTGGGRGTTRDRNGVLHIKGQSTVSRQSRREPILEPREAAATSLEVADSDISDSLLYRKSIHYMTGLPVQPFWDARKIRDARKTAKIEALAKSHDADPKIHVRFGDIPEDGVSHNEMTGQDEAGVSVFDAWLTSDGRAIIDPRTSSFGALMFFSDRPMIRVEGDLLDRTGGDGEPLLSNCRHIETLAGWEVLH